MSCKMLFLQKSCSGRAGSSLLEPTRALAIVRSRPGKPNQRKGQNEKFMNFAHFCEFWCFSLGNQARFTLNFCSGMPLRKVHAPTFPWFGLLGRLLQWGWGCLGRNERPNNRARDTRAKTLQRAPESSRRLHPCKPLRLAKRQLSNILEYFLSRNYCLLSEKSSCP